MNNPLFEIQQLIVANAERYAKKHDVTFTREVMLCKLMEETGEFAEALLVQDGQCRDDKQCEPKEAREHVAEELADVLATVLLFASKLDMDVYDALDKKILQKGRDYLASSES